MNPPAFAAAEADVEVLPGTPALSFFFSACSFLLVVKILLSSWPGLFVENSAVEAEVLSAVAELDAFVPEEPVVVLSFCADVVSFFVAALSPFAPFLPSGATMKEFQ